MAMILNVPNEAAQGLTDARCYNMAERPPWETLGILKSTPELHVERFRKQVIALSTLEMA